MKHTLSGAADSAPRSRHLAQATLAVRGSIGFAQLLAAIALIEIGIAAVSVFVGPDESMPFVMRDLGNFMRAIYGGVAFVMTLRFMPLARSSGAHALALGAATCFAFATLVGALPFFDIVPSIMEDSLWDALLQTVRAIAFVAGAGLLVWTARAFATHKGQRGIAQLAAWCMLPLAICLPVSFQAIDPLFVPTPWVAPALALALPFGVALGGLLRWDLAGWWALGVLTLGGILLFGRDANPATYALVGVVGVLALTAWSVGTLLRSIVSVLDDTPSGTVSRTLIARLMEGSLGNEGSRVGNLPPSTSRPGGDASDDAASLARAYHELGINAEIPYEPTDAAPPAVVSQLIPKVVVDKPIIDESADEDGRLAAVLVLPVAWTGTYDALRWCFVAFVARVLVVVFGLVLSSSPLTRMMPALMLFDLALLGSALPFVRGLYAMRKAPLDTLRIPANIAFTFAALVVALDLTLFVLRLLDGAATSPVGGLSRGLWLALDALAGVVAVAAYLVLLRRLNTHLRHPKLSTRTRGTLMLLGAWSAFAAGTVIANELPASDLQWLAFPFGFATAGVGFGLWIALLWLTRDTQEALRP